MVHFVFFLILGRSEEASDAGDTFVVAATRPIRVAGASVVERKMMGEDEHAKKIIVLMYLCSTVKFCEETFIAQPNRLWNFQENFQNSQPKIPREFLVNSSKIPA